MRIAYIFLPGRTIRSTHFNKISFPSEFFYGVIELRRRGYKVDILEIDDSPRRGWGRFLAERLHKKKYLPVKMNISVLDAVRLKLADLKNYDIVVATTTGIAFSVMFWKNIFRLPFRVVGIISGILNYETNYARLWLSRYLLSKMAVHLFGDAEKDPLCKKYRIANSVVTVNNFGVDCNFWINDFLLDIDGYVLSVGNDAMRDFEVLIEAAKFIERKVVIVTNRIINVIIPNNVFILRGSWQSQGISDEELRKMYCKAFCVVVPLKESYQPSGQSVTLQAMSCSKPVVLTKTIGLWDTDNLQHAENLLFVRAGEPKDIVTCVNQLENGTINVEDLCRQAREYVMKFGNIEAFADRLERTFHKVGAKKTGN